ncbi:MAG: type II toxin-antitoxin system YoeB family toxin [Tannerella sp.]|jgi:Txe/YoeB family toxin of Txe-Axe toxin-antitoxin module|nr:type II toxin-antitoxin system YoeB family toxin [Tannerella sp.]
MKAYETKDARKDKALILKSHPKGIQSKLLYLVNDILEEPRNLSAIGNPELLKHAENETWSRELTRKDRVVYAIEPGSDYNMPEEKFYQYLGHYRDK